MSELKEIFFDLETKQQSTEVEGGEEAFKLREKKYGIKHHRYETLPEA